jgi:hypothetical protein
VLVYRRIVGARDHEGQKPAVRAAIIEKLAPGPQVGVSQVGGGLGRRQQRDGLRHRWERAHGPEGVDVTEGQPVLVQPRHAVRDRTSRTRPGRR